MFAAIHQNTDRRVHVEQYPLMNRSTVMAAAKTEVLTAAEKLMAKTSLWQMGADNNQLNAARATAAVTVMATARLTTMAAAGTEAQQPTSTNITTMAATGRKGPLAPIPHANASERARQGPLGAKT
jgi:hypothetical protein